MLLFLLVFFLLSSCLETIDIIGKESSLVSNRTSSLDIALLDENNEEIALSKQPARPTTLYANQFQGTRLDLSIQNARGVNFVDLRKIEPPGDTLRREISKPGFSHFFQLAENGREQLYSVSRQNGEEFYIKITAQPTLIVNIFGETLYQSVPFALSFASAPMTISFEGAQKLNRIQVLPYSFSDSLAGGSSVFLEYQDEAMIDVVEMSRKIREESLSTSDLYQIRINMATDVLGHRSSNPGSYLLRQINPGAPLRYSIFFNSGEGLQKTDINFCSAGIGELSPCSSPGGGLEAIDFGNQGSVFLEGLPAQESSNPIEQALQQPISLVQFLGGQIGFSSVTFQEKSGEWEQTFGESLLSNGNVWLISELDYQENDLLSYDSFFQVHVELPNRTVYRTEKLSFRFPCSRVVVQDSQSEEYQSLDDADKYADLRDNRENSVFKAFPSSLGLTALNTPPSAERQVCTDYTGAEYDNYYTLPSVSESDNNQWRNLKFALAWNENWNYEDFRYSFVAERQEVKAGVEWIDISFDVPAVAQRYIAFDLLEQDILDDAAKRSILRYRLRPVAQHLEIPEALYKRPISYYFIRYPQLYPGMKKLYLENPEQETYADNLLFIDLEADFLTNTAAGSAIIEGFFRYNDKESIRQTPGNAVNYYQLASNEDSVASLKFFIPTDDNFGTSETDYEARLTGDRRRVKSWRIDSDIADIRFLDEQDNDYKQFLSISEDNLGKFDRVLDIDARNEVPTRDSSCGLITVALIMSDGDTTSSEFFLCVGDSSG